jgi:hypothetical protein
MFVSNEPVPVNLPDDPSNIIYIRPKMDFGTKQKVQTAMLQITLGQAGSSSETPLDMGAYNIALLVHNIVRWEGPAFVDAQGRPVPCTPANIERLDSDEPLVDAVMAEINRRNKGRDDQDPKSPSASGTAGAPPLTVVDGTAWEAGTSTSPAPNGTSGRPRKLTPVTPTS